MNYKSKMKKLRRLMAEDSERFQAELGKPWPDMDDDLRSAQIILYRHIGKQGPQRLIEDFKMPPEEEMSPNSMISVKLPEWIVDVSNDFYERYSDPDERQFRFQRTINMLVSDQVLFEDDAA